MNRCVYGYDDLDRLVATVEPTEAKLYQLDAVGNRTGEKKTTPAAARALGLVVAAFAALAPADTLANIRGDFNNADWLTARRTLSANGLSELSRIDFGHDANGNTTAEQSPTSLREYRWDIRNTLTSALQDGVMVGNYDYDFQFQRVSRTAGGSTVEYVLDDKLVLNELDGSHTSTRRYHFGAMSPLAVVDSAGPRFLLNDGLGSVSDEVTPSGGLFKQRQYNAWGEYRNATAPALNEPKLGYEGHQYDPETSLTYARARYLDNRYGVLLSRDVVEGNINDAPTLHRYAWVRDNPLRFLDFSGNDPSQISERENTIIDALKDLGPREFPHAAQILRDDPNELRLAPVTRGGAARRWAQEKVAVEKEGFAALERTRPSPQEAMFPMLPFPTRDASEHQLPVWKMRLAGVPEADIAKMQALAKAQDDLRQAGAYAMLGGAAVGGVAGALMEGGAESLLGGLCSGLGRAHNFARDPLGFEPMFRSALEAPAGDLLSLTFARSPELGAESSMEALMSGRLYPGREGVMLSDRTIRFGDVHSLSEQLGVEVGLSREVVGDTRRFVLRSGSATSVRGPAPIEGNRSIAHTHLPQAIGEGEPRIDLPSRTDINTLDRLYQAQLQADVRATPPMSRVIWGPAPEQQTFFGPSFR